MKTFLRKFFRRRHNAGNTNMFRVTIVMDQAATRYTYSWRVVEARRSLHREDRLQLDAQVAAFMRAVNEQPPSQPGTKTLDKWF